jgi:hypothetical protein
MRRILVFRESEWSSQACEKFAELVSLTRKISDKILIAKVRGYNKRTITNSYEESCKDLVIPCIDLYDYSSDPVRQMLFLAIFRRRVISKL